jgi:PAS domain S-box-containing protein
MKGLTVATVWAGVTTWTPMARKRQREHQERLHAMLACFEAAIILTDARGAITAMNGAAQSLTGWDEASALGSPVGAVFQLLDRRTHRPVVNPVVRALYKDIVVGPSHDTILLSKDGKERQVRDTASPIHDRHGRVVGCALVGREPSETAVRGQRVEIREARH